MCLQGSDIPHENESFKVSLVNCSENSKYQKWILFPVEWHWLNSVSRLSLPLPYVQSKLKTSATERQPPQPEMTYYLFARVHTRDQQVIGIDSAQLDGGNIRKKLITTATAAAATLNNTLW